MSLSGGLTAELGGGVDDMLPLSCADFSIDLAMNFLHQIVFISIVAKKITVACFAGKDSLSVLVKAAANFGIHENGVAARTESPCVCGVTGHV